MGSAVLNQTMRGSPAESLRAVPVASVACSSMLETSPTWNFVCCTLFADKDVIAALTGQSLPTLRALDACAIEGKR